MAKKIAILLPLFAVAACAMPDLPGGPADDPAWFDSRVAREGEVREAPQSIPNTVITPAEDAERAAAAEATRRSGEMIRNAERANPDATNDTDDFANAARDRATPPNRPD